MALPKAKSSAASKLVDTVSSLRAVTVRVPSGGQTITLSKSSSVVAGSGFDVVASASQTVWLSEGESLYGIAASGEQAYELI